MEDNAILDFGQGFIKVNKDIRANPLFISAKLIESCLVFFLSIGVPVVDLKQWSYLSRRVYLISNIALSILRHVVGIIVKMGLVSIT